MKFINLFNVRTFSVLLISLVATFFVIRFQIKVNTDPVLFSLAIAFPLAFSIQAAFKRRDRALEYFSLFEAGVVALHNSFRISEDLPPDKKQEIGKTLVVLVHQLFHQLEHRETGYSAIQGAADNILEFIERNRDNISKRNILRIIRYLRDITESSAYLISLVTHRTMAGLRFYVVFFIFIFPLVQAPMMNYRFGSSIPSWGIYCLVAFTSLILITLSNFQTLIEYPFDRRGIDNIQLHTFTPNINHQE
ncbi:MAG: hypothetical protein JNM57_07780 [Cyclobacteriaceae bacterium]|nr:hypothetical protein [Cyclobacteriaceae bacterium]